MRLVINGTEVRDGTPFRDHRIYFPANLLREGKNLVTIRFVSRYVKDCQGMQYFVDKDDSLEYMYSQHEAADAHKVFPCFDQPDIKAPYTLLVLVP
jgi:aminopeptidase N